MNELWEHALLPYNMPLTVLLGLMAVYWVFSLIGAADFDFDFDVEADADGDVGSGHHILGAILKFVNAQDIPIMMVLSFLTLFMWSISLLANSILNPGHSNLIALGILVVNFIVSTLIVKAITQPLRPLFRAIKKDEKHEPLIGAVGVVKSRVIDENYGQISVPRAQGAPALLNAYLDEGALVRGEPVLVLSYDDSRKRYLVKSTPELLPVEG